MRDILLVTGGAGFIGCALATALLGRTEPLVVVDAMLSKVHGTSGHPPALPSGVELVRADIRDRAFWRGFFRQHRPRRIIHLAAETGTGQSLTDAASHASVNVTGLAEMLDAMSAAGQRPDHILLASSRAVYGEGTWVSADGTSFHPVRRRRERLDRGEWDFASPDGRDARPEPHQAGRTFPVPCSIYGATKLAQEHLLTSWTDAYGVSLTILRLQNVYGPGQSLLNAYSGVVTLFQRQAMMGERIAVFEDGRIGRDFIYVDDVVASFSAALEKPAAGIRTFDVGSGQVTTIADAAAIIAGLHGAPAPRATGRFRDGDVRWAVCDPEPLAIELGVRARTSFAQGARYVAEWLAGGELEPGRGAAAQKPRPAAETAVRQHGLRSPRDILGRAPRPVRRRALSLPAVSTADKSVISQHGVKDAGDERRG